MKKINLTQGKYALVDDEDYEYLNQWKWCAHNYHNRAWYATRDIGIAKCKKKTIMMHRLIMNCPASLVIDHRDRDGLNNQKCNLRICSLAENNRNAKRRKDNVSGYKGVYPIKNKYKAHIKYNGKELHLGTFDDVIAAAKVYDKKAKEIYGEFARLNFNETTQENKL